MKINYKINNIGWIGLFIIMMLLSLFSCKKDKSVTSSGSSSTTSSIDGCYIDVDGSPVTRDTMYLFTIGTTHYMSCPDLQAQPMYDTIEYLYNEPNITIPSQVIYGIATIQGNGSVFSNTLTLDWTFSNYSKHKVYLKQ